MRANFTNRKPHDLPQASLPSINPPFLNYWRAGFSVSFDLSTGIFQRRHNPYSSKTFKTRADLLISSRPAEFEANQVCLLMVQLEHWRYAVKLIHNRSKRIVNCNLRKRAEQHTVEWLLFLFLYLQRKFKQKLRCTYTTRLFKFICRLLLLFLEDFHQGEILS